MTWLEQVEAAPYRHGFLAVARRIDVLNRHKPRLGRSLRPLDDAVRFAQEPSVTFAPATLAKVDAGAKSEAGGPDRPTRISTFFFGLFGPNGPLPLHLTEYARDRLRNADDPTFTRFADMFHHRMLSLFYRAWADSRPTVQFDRPESDRFATYVGALTGRGMPSLRGRDAMPDLAKLHFAGRLASQRRNADGLVAILAGFFRLPVRLEEFVGEWLGLPDRSLSRLGGSRETGTLGSSAMLGRAVWGRQHKFRIVFGPLDLNQYERLLPGGESLRRLVPVVRNYVGLELSWDVNMILEADQVPPTRLGRAGRLGWTTWLGKEGRVRDAADLFLDPSGKAL